MMGMRSALVLTVPLAALGCFGGATVAASDELPAQSNIAADNQPTPDASLRKRAEELARAASERFSEIMAGGRKSKVAQDVAQGAVPEAEGAPRSPGAADDAFSPVRGWLARSAKDYEDVIIAKLKNPSGDVLILAPQGTVIAQKDAVPEVPDQKVPELPETRATEPKAGWSWDRVMEASRDWLARANRSYRNEIVKKLVRPEQPQAPDAAAQWPPAEVVPQTPAPAPAAAPPVDTAAEAESERHAAEVRRAAEEAEAQRAQEAEAQKQAEDDKRRQQAEAKKQADEAEAKRKADAEAKRVADEAETKRKGEEKRLADEAEAKRKAEEKRLADEAEAKRKADAEAKRVAAEVEAKRQAEAKRLAEEAEAKRKANAEEKRLADAAEAKRKADTETARRLKEEAETEHKAVAEAEATRMATEAEAKRAAAAGRKPAYENSSVAVARPRAPTKPPTVTEQDRKARKEALAMEPVPPKIVKKKRRVVVAYDAGPKKGKHGQLASRKHGHKHEYVIVESREPKRIVHAYRQKSHAAPPLPLRNEAPKAPTCACTHAYGAAAPKPHHVSRHAYSAPRVVWRTCGEDSYFEPAPRTHHRKARAANLILHRPRLYMSPGRR